MPRVTKKRKRGRRWMDDHTQPAFRFMLSIGGTFEQFRMDDPGSEFMKTAWNYWRQALMNSFISERPGTRPWGFWNAEGHVSQLRDGESRLEYLERIGEISDAERAAIDRLAAR